MAIQITLIILSIFLNFSLRNFYFCRWFSASWTYFDCIVRPYIRTHSTEQHIYTHIIHIMTMKNGFEYIMCHEVNLGVKIDGYRKRLWFAFTFNHNEYAFKHFIVTFFVPSFTIERFVFLAVRIFFLLPKNMWDSLMLKLLGSFTCNYTKSREYNSFDIVIYDIGNILNEIN